FGLRASLTAGGTLRAGGQGQRLRGRALGEGAPSGGRRHRLRQAGDTVVVFWAEDGAGAAGAGWGFDAAVAGARGGGAVRAIELGPGHRDDRVAGSAPRGMQLAV